MPGPYSIDLRERVVQSVLDGNSRRSAARLFGVGISSVVRWVQRRRACGNVAAKPMGGSRLKLLSERDWLLMRLGEQPDVTLRGLQAELATRGIVVSHYAIWNLFAREGISFKKKPARQRTGSSGRDAPACPLAEVSGTH